MIIRCQKVKRHKPRKVRNHVLIFGGIEAPLFADSEILDKSKGREETQKVREALLSMIP